MKTQYSNARKIVFLVLLEIQAVPLIFLKINIDIFLLMS